MLAWIPRRLTLSLGLAFGLQALVPVSVMAKAKPKPAPKAGEAKKKAKKKVEKKKSPTEKLKAAWEDQVKGSRAIPGFLDMRLKEGKLYLELPPAKMGKPMLFFASLYRGVGEGWFLGGMLQMGVNWSFEFRKVHDAVQLVHTNVRFTAKAGTPVADAVGNSFSDSVLAKLEPVAISPSGAYLLPLDATFRADFLGLGKGLSAQLGTSVSPDSGRSRWEQVKSFPVNTELRLALAFKGSDPWASPHVPDGRYPEVGVQYSFRALPEKGYEPRVADDRVGYFLTVRKDYSSQAPDAPWARYANRWRLEKADPKAPRSPVKKPVVYYLGRNVPYRWRPYLRAGILEWNKAFAQAGLLDALEVRYQAEDDDWDAEDVRYNTISWVLGDVPFGAVGPSRIDPRTGEILDADILFSGDIIRRFWLGGALDGIKDPAADKAGLPAAWGMRSDPAKALLPSHECRAVSFMGSAFPLAAADLLATSSVEATVSTSASGETTPSAEGQAPPLPEAFVGAALKWIVMHEVGHTLGLRHNFKASSIRTRAQLSDAVFTREHGLSGSVMDYLAANLARGEEAQGEYFTSTVGPYDKWAIEYAYTPVKGVEELAKIASRAPEPELAYATDEDRSFHFNRKLDPLVNAGDLSDDPLEDARRRVARVKELYPKLLERLVWNGRRYTMARDFVTGLMRNVQGAGDVATVYVGGQYEHRDHKGDPEARPIFVPVEAEKQREALKFLAESIFSDESFPTDPALLNRLAPDHWRHWGGRGLGARIDYPIHALVGRIQLSVLLRLLDPWALERMLDVERKVAEDADLFTAEELLGGLDAALFQELDVKPGSRKWTARASYVSSFRRNLQRSYVAVLGQLARNLGAVWSSDARILARTSLRRLEKRFSQSLRAADRLDTVSRAHLEDLQARAASSLKPTRRAAGP